MKRIIVFIVATTLWSVTFFRAEASAAEISAGATTWYSWWDMKTSGGDGDKEMDPKFLYGPAFSVKFSDDYNLTFVFLYGTFDMEEDSGTEEISRYDSDLALNYRLGNYFKLFAGAKYMAYEMENFSHRSIGPGAGISAVLPVGGNFYLLGNISGLYLWGTHKQDDSSGTEQKTDYVEYGMNSSLSAAYYIAPSSVTLSLGGRYQYFKTDFESDDPDNSDMDHHFYGVTAAATYSFTL